MEITGIPATNSIAFKGENDDFLAIKTKNPTSPTDAVTKAWLDTEVELITNSIDELDTKITDEISRATQAENDIKEDVNGTLLTDFPVTAKNYSGSSVAVTAKVNVLKFNTFALIQVQCRSTDRSSNFNEINVDLSSLSPSLTKNVAFGSAGYIYASGELSEVKYYSWPVQLLTTNVLRIGNSVLAGYKLGDATVYATAILFF